MKLRVMAAACIFLGSYLPLSLILLAQNYDYAYAHAPFCWDIFRSRSGCVLPLKNPSFALGIFLICLGCFAVTLAALKLARTKRSIVVVECKHVPAELMNYVIPYVVSFMSIDYQDVGKFVGLLIFLGWMFWITYKSGQIILNPLLTAFNWRLYELTYRDSGQSSLHSGIALSHIQLVVQGQYQHAKIQDVIII
jgi:hypothetical protein